MLGRNLTRLGGGQRRPQNMEDKQFLEKKTMEVPGKTSVMTDSPVHCSVGSQATNPVKICHSAFRF